MTRRAGIVGMTLLFVLSLAFVNPYVRGDGNGYYAWLTSPLIDGDVHFGNQYLHADPSFRTRFIDDRGQPTSDMRTVTGKVENQWSVGPAILWLPAFAIGHAAALAGLGTPDGYSPPYLWAVAVSTAVYGMVSILIGVDLARRFGSGRWAGAAAVAILFASSLPVYMYLLPFHVHALAAFATGLFFWWGLVRLPSARPAVWALWGLISGLMVAVYFIHAVFLIVVAWRLLELPRWRAGVLAAAAFTAGLLPPAGIHLASRFALYGSVTTTGYRDEFFWLSPRLVATALSPEHGLFLWTPVVALALAGLVLLARRDPRARLILVAWAVLFYAIASYQNWHGQSSFGNRFFVSLTAVLVPGAAAALGWIAHRGRPLAWALVVVLALWNAGFVFQWGLNLVPNRGPVDFAVVARNQVTVVPARLTAVVRRYFLDRGGFTRDVEADDVEERRDYRLRR
ncbi:MAG: hypothetical protein H0X44_01160 [Acidobacteria bacterium]|nr:hypothetical protein [Acidobacteriota bacterium]